MTNASSNPISVGLISLGCAKNLVDSQLMAGTLLSENIRLAPSPEEADIIIINTCAFIEDAREESIDTITDTCRLKQEGRCKAVLVAGCLPQRYQRELAESLPDVDAFIGLDELDKVGEFVRQIRSGETGIYSVSSSAARLYEPAVPGLVFTAGAYAYLKVAEGCNHRCAFCAIPAIRGNHRSRSVEGALSQSKKREQHRRG